LAVLGHRIADRRLDDAIGRRQAKYLARIDEIRVLPYQGAITPVEALDIFIKTRARVNIQHLNRYLGK
jgi:hypothetical protein